MIAELLPLAEPHLAAVARLEDDAQIHPWSEHQLRDSLEAGHRGLVALGEKGRVLGYSLTSCVLGEAELLNIAVAPAAQGRGVGGRLLRATLETLAGAAQCVFLEVRVSNAPAIALYRKHGFVEVGRRRHYYPGPEGREDALVMRCDLQAANGTVR